MHHGAGQLRARRAAICHAAQGPGGIGWVGQERRTPWCLHQCPRAPRAQARRQVSTLELIHKGAENWPLKAPPAPFRRALICACSRMHAHDCMRSWGGLCELHDHVALPTDPPDAPGRLRSVAGVHSTCSQLTSCSLHVVAALRTALRVGAVRPLQTLSADPWHELSRPAKRELLIRPSAALATASLCGFHPEVQSG